MALRYFAAFSGIHAPGVAWDPLGWECLGFSEIESFPCSVLKAHYPGVPNLGDITKVSDERLRSLRADGVALVVGGAPCQSFSVAGLRRGLADPRGNLTLEFLRVVDRVRPRWVLFENVPGLLSSVSHAGPDAVPPADPVDVGSPQEVVVEDEYDADEVSAFACLVAGLSELGYGVAWGSLDAQYFHLAQRRERVFVVACLGDEARAWAVLLDREGLQGTPPPGREEGQGVARCLADRPDRGPAGGQPHNFIGADGQPLNALGAPAVARALTAPRNGAGGSYRAQEDVDTLIPEVKTFQETGQGWLNESPVAATVRTPDGGSSHHANLVGVPEVAGSMGEVGGKGRPGDTPDGAASGYLVPEVAHSLRGEGFDASEDGTGRGTPLVTVVYKNHAQEPLAFTQNQREEIRDLGDVAGAVKTPGTHEATFIAEPQAFAKSRRAQNPDDDETWKEGEVAPTLNAFDQGDIRATVAIVEPTVVGFSANDCGEDAAEERAPAMRAGAGGGRNGPAVSVPAMRVRRLTPTECERLQGFPPVVRTCTILVCHDSSAPQVSPAPAGALSLKLPSSASDVAAVESGGPAHGAEGSSLSDPVSHAAPVLLRVHVDLVERRVEIRSLERSLSFAVGVDEADSSRQPTEVESIVRAVAVIFTAAAPSRLGGGGGSPRGLESFSPRDGGSFSVRVSGRDIEGSAAGVVEGTGLQSEPLKSTMSDPTPSGRRPARTQTTSFSSAIRAIAGYIPARTAGASSYSIVLEEVRGWTQVETRKLKHRKKCLMYDPENKGPLILGPDEPAPCSCKVKVVPAEDCPDGPRYRALGNSMATTVLRWIGERIDALVRFEMEMEAPEVTCPVCHQATTWVPPGTPCRSPRHDGTICTGTLEEVSHG